MIMTETQKVLTTVLKCKNLIRTSVILVRNMSLYFLNCWKFNSIDEKLGVSIRDMYVIRDGKVKMTTDVKRATSEG